MQKRGWTRGFLISILTPEFYDFKHQRKDMNLFFFFFGVKTVILCIKVVMLAPLADKHQILVV